MVGSRHYSGNKESTSATSSPESRARRVDQDEEEKWSLGISKRDHRRLNADPPKLRNHPIGHTHRTPHGSDSCNASPSSHRQRERHPHQNGKVSVQDSPRKQESNATRQKHNSFHQNQYSKTPSSPPVQARSTRTISAAPTPMPDTQDLSQNNPHPDHLSHRPNCDSKTPGSSPAPPPIVPLDRKKENLPECVVGHCAGTPESDAVSESEKAREAAYKVPPGQRLIQEEGASNLPLFGSLSICASEYDMPRLGRLPWVYPPPPEENNLMRYRSIRLQRQPKRNMLPAVGGAPILSEPVGVFVSYPIRRSSNPYAALELLCGIQPLHDVMNESLERFKVSERVVFQVAEERAGGDVQQKKEEKPKPFSYAAALGPASKSRPPNGVLAFSISNKEFKSPLKKDGDLPDLDSIPRELRNPFHVLQRFNKSFEVSFDGSRMRERQRMRGLVNDGNMCYLNAILHPLTHCLPFYNLIHSLVSELPEHCAEGLPPIVGALKLLFDKFDLPGEKSDYIGPSFSPRPIYESLQIAKRFAAVQGAQEDADEFLGYLLDGLHEELSAASLPCPTKGKKSESAADNGSSCATEQNDEDGWQLVGRMNKVQTMRRIEFEDSPVNKVFGGMTRSVVGRPGSKETATLEPFRTIILDISAPEVNSLSDALRLMTQREHIEGGSYVKQQFFEHVPPVLIFSLKRYGFSSEEGVTKLHKHVNYPVQLELPNQLFYNRQPSFSGGGGVHGRVSGGKGPVYRLFAVVYHHGHIAGAGHYSCDILRRQTKAKNQVPGGAHAGGHGSGHGVALNGASSSPPTNQSANRRSWVHLDDTDIRPISVSEVVKATHLTDQGWPSGTHQHAPGGRHNRLAYLLFYESCAHLCGSGEAGSVQDLMAEAGLRDDGFEVAKGSPRQSRRV